MESVLPEEMRAGFLLFLWNLGRGMRHSKSECEDREETLAAAFTGEPLSWERFMWELLF